MRERRCARVPAGAGILPRDRVGPTADIARKHTEAGTVVASSETVGGFRRTFGPMEGSDEAEPGSESLPAGVDEIPDDARSASNRRGNT